MSMPSPAIRRWIYGITMAALPLLIVADRITETTAPLWAALIGSILVPGLAAANVPPNDDDYEPRHRE